MKIARAVLVSGALALVVTTAALAATSVQALRPPVSTFVSPSFGKVLSRTNKQALYTWTVEKNAGGKVKCLGSCAKAWPPLVVRSKTLVPKRVAGIKGVFGTIRRPDGKIQVTRNKLPLYAYAHEQPHEVLCDNVDGWFVVRV